MESNRKAIVGNFLYILEHKFPELTESQRWRIANELAQNAYDHDVQQAKNKAEMYTTIALELEQYRKQFRDHIQLLEKNAKIMIESFKKQGFVKPDIDPKTRKPKLLGRTSMVDEMVVFLNTLNEQVMQFYQNVYKINDKDDAYQAGVQQTSLFQ